MVYEALLLGAQASRGEMVLSSESASIFQDFMGWAWFVEAEVHLNNLQKKWMNFSSPHTLNIA